MIPSDEQLIDWLQDMRRHASRDADRATRLLEIIDQAFNVTGHREEMGDAAYGILVLHGLIVGDEPEPFLKRICEQHLALRKLCWDAEIVPRGDHNTDVIPLLRLFVPC